MTRIVLTFPLAAGKVEAWRRFCQELAGSRWLLYIASRRRLQVGLEQMGLSQTPSGAAGTTTLEAHDLAWVLSELITSDRPFERWYRERVEALHAISLAQYAQYVPAAGASPPQELLFEWDHPGRAGQSLK